MNVPTQPGWLMKLATLVTGAILLIVGLMFSLVLVGVIALAGIVLWGYLWWQTRKLRRQVPPYTASGDIIEGEAVVVHDNSTEHEIILLHDPKRGNER